MRYIHREIEKELKKFSFWNLHFGNESPKKNLWLRGISFISTLITCPILAFQHSNMSTLALFIGVIVALFSGISMFRLLLLALTDIKGNYLSVNTKKASIIKEKLVLEELYNTETIKNLVNQCLRLAKKHRRNYLDWTIVLGIITITISIFAIPKVANDLNIDIYSVLFIVFFFVAFKICKHTVIDELSNTKRRRYEQIALLLEELLVRERKFK